MRLYINYVRKKIEKDPAHHKYILTERGVGYRFVDYKREKLAEKGEQSSQDATQEEAD